MKERFEPDKDRRIIEDIIDACNERNVDEKIDELSEIFKKSASLGLMTRTKIEKEIINTDESLKELDIIKNKNIAGEEKMISDQMHELFSKSRALRKIFERFFNKE
jgi:hypothetical protein